MSGELVRLEDTTVTRCLGMKIRHLSYWARGLQGRPFLAEGLEYIPHESGDYRSDKISDEDACVLWARIILETERSNSVPCFGCPSTEKVNNDLMVQRLKAEHNL